MFLITFPDYWSCLDCSVVLERYGVTDYDWIVVTNPRAVVAHQPVPPIPQPVTVTAI
jgi:hypothetical protein